MGGEAYIWRVDLMEGFLRYEFGGSLYLEGLIFGILQYAGFILVECLIFTNVFTSTTHCNILKKTVN